MRHLPLVEREIKVKSTNTIMIGHAAYRLEVPGMFAI